MTYLKKIIFAASLTVASLGMSVAANAALVTHELIFDNGFDPAYVIGELSVRVADTDILGEQDIYF